MKKLKKLIVLAMAITTLLGATLTVNAATPRNTWCHAGAADHQVGSGTHYCGGSNHSYTIWQCSACGNLEMFCKNNQRW